MFEAEFRHCLSSYTSPFQVAEHWNEIETAYTARGRYYHTLRHLDHLISELIPCQHQFRHWATVVFAMAYHDIIYSVIRNDNEEQSASLAVKRLKSFGFDPQHTEHCSRLILATKKHEAADTDTNLFVDADLSVLGATPEAYMEYTLQVRSEYAIYPDLIYRPGRKKVIQHFLDMPRIFKTDSFHDRYEARARVNLQWELTQL